MFVHHSVVNHDFASVKATVCTTQNRACWGKTNAIMLVTYFLGSATSFLSTSSSFWLAARPKSVFPRTMEEVEYEAWVIRIWLIFTNVDQCSWNNRTLGFNPLARSD